jgi:hypothetical protein|nr:hypothetical protein [Kofleriaceae bacterium]
MKWLVGLAALVLGCALLVHVLGGSDAATGHGPTATAPPAGSGDSTAAPTSSPLPPEAPNPFVARDRPALPVASTAPKQTAGQQFAAEERDNHWAAVTEIALRDRLAGLRDVRVAAPECHDTICRLQVTGSQQAIGRAISDLGTSKHGIRDLAQSVILSAPEQTSDGLRLVAYARFQR